MKEIKIWGLLSSIIPNPRYSRHVFHPRRSTTSIKMQGDPYPCEVHVLSLNDSNINIFGDHNGEPFSFYIFEALFHM
jgi:hypothetical protein